MPEGMCCPASVKSQHYRDTAETLDITATAKLRPFAQKPKALLSNRSSMYSCRTNQLHILVTAEASTQQFYCALPDSLNMLNRM